MNKPEKKSLPSGNGWNRAEGIAEKNKAQPHKEKSAPEL